MRELTDNPYLSNTTRRFGEYTLNSYLFGEFVSERAVNTRTLLAALRELLSSLGFGMEYMGYEFLVRLVAYSVVQSAYTFNEGILRLSELYGTDEQIIRDNIDAILDINKSFATRASKLLRRKISSEECKHAATAVTIIQAVFKTYYNYKVTSGSIADGINTVNYLKVIVNGK